MWLQIPIATTCNCPPQALHIKILSSHLTSQARNHALPLCQLELKSNYVFNWKENIYRVHTWNLTISFNNMLCFIPNFFNSQCPFLSFEYSFVTNDFLTLVQFHQFQCVIFVDGLHIFLHKNHPLAIIIPINYL